MHAEDDDLGDAPDVEPDYDSDSGMLTDSKNSKSDTKTTLEIAFSRLGVFRDDQRAAREARDDSESK